MERKERFFARWSRLKRAEANVTPAPAPPAAAPAAATLPTPDTLDVSSDFSAFLQPRVEESLKRAALKKLFHSEHFNRMDGLDVYIDDYGRFEPIPEEMLRRLEQARGLLFPSDEDKAGRLPVQTDAAGAHADPQDVPQSTPSHSDETKEA